MLSTMVAFRAAMTRPGDLARPTHRPVVSPLWPKARTRATAHEVTAAGETVDRPWWQKGL